MATTVITRTQKESKSPIKFFRVLRKGDLTFTTTTNVKPNQFKFVELVASRYGGKVGTDLIFAHNDLQTAANGTLFLGDWGDGTVDEKEVVVEPIEGETTAQ